MLFSHHLNGLLRTVEVELVILFSFLRVLLGAIAAFHAMVGSSVGAAPGIVNDALVEGLVCESHLIRSTISP